MILKIIFFEKNFVSLEKYFTGIVCFLLTGRRRRRTQETSATLRIPRNPGRHPSIFIDTLLQATKKCHDARFIYNHRGVYARNAACVTHFCRMLRTSVITRIAAIH